MMGRGDTEGVRLIELAIFWRHRLVARASQRRGSMHADRWYVCAALCRAAGLDYHRGWGATWTLLHAGPVEVVRTAL